MNYETIFKAIGEPTRIKIIRLLSHKPMFVCELESVLDMSQPRISQHLKILKHANIVEDEREGQRSVYRLNIEFLKHGFSHFLDFLEQPLEALDGFQKEYGRICHLTEDPNVATCKNCCTPANLDQK